MRESEIFKVALEGDGRIAIPKTLQKAIGTFTGDELFMKVEDGVLVIWSPEAAFINMRIALAREMSKEKVDATIEEQRRALHELAVVDPER